MKSISERPDVVSLATSMMALVLCVGSAAADADRWLTLRDGSVLRVRLEAGALTFVSRGDDGAARRRGLALADVDELTLAPRRPTDVLAEVARLVGQLDARRWRDREKASARLTAIGAPFRRYLEHRRKTASSVEVQTRLEAILAVLPEARAVVAGFDTLGQEAGDAGDLRVRARWGERALSFDRSTLRRLSKTAPKRTAAPAQQLAGAASRMGDTDRELGPVTRITFDKDPGGRALKPGVDVSETFVPLGVRLSTSIAGAIVSVNTYTVGGRSRGMSCATHKPLYQGVVTIRFCQPGRANVPATVTRVGFWCAAVSPKGTALEAFDVRDRRIATIETVKGSSDWLGVKSAIPIAYVKIVPNKKIDPDYTFDDLTFDRPRPIASEALSSRWSVRLRDGQRLAPTRVTVADGRWKAEGLAWADGVEGRLSSVARIDSPIDGWKAGKTPGGFWILLRDGSLVRGAAGPTRARSRLDLKAEEIAAFCGDEHALAVAATPPAIFVGGKETPIARWRLREESIRFAGAGGGWTEVRYGQTTACWLAKAAVVGAETPRVELLSGERFVLGGATELLELGADLRLRIGGRALTIARADVRTVVLPK